MKQTTIVAIVLGILVLISAVQAYQLSSIKSSTKDANLQLSTGSSKQGVSVASGSSDKKTASLPSSVKDLPQMVGGC